MCEQILQHIWHSHVTFMYDDHIISQKHSDASVQNNPDPTTPKPEYIPWTEIIIRSKYKHFIGCKFRNQTLLLHNFIPCIWCFCFTVVNLNGGPYMIEMILIDYDSK